MKKLIVFLIFCIFKIFQSNIINKKYYKIVVLFYKEGFILLWYLSLLIIFTEYIRFLNFVVVLIRSANDAVRSNIARSQNAQDTVLVVDIESLPTKVVHKEEKSGSSIHCSICLKSYIEGEDLRVVSCPSQHEFHTNCVDEWLKLHYKCPLCRHDVRVSRRSVGV